MLSRNQESYETFKIPHSWTQTAAGTYTTLHVHCMHRVSSLFSFIYQQITKKEVLNNEDLLNSFQMFMRCHQSTHVDDKLTKILFREILTRVVNTMSNSFFQCMDMMERVSANKGVEAQMALRDKLKAYALEVESKIHI